MMSATDGDDDDETRLHGHDEHGHKDDDIDYELDRRTSTGIGTRGEGGGVRGVIAPTATREEARARAHKLPQLLARGNSGSGPADGCCRLLITAADGAHCG